MTFSEYMAAAKAAVTHVRSSVRYRGLNTAGGWIRDPLNVPQKFAARIDSKIQGAQRSAQYQGRLVGEYYINEMEKLARDTNTGNCSELTAVAFNYLKARGVSPIDYFAVFRGSWNHAFVILNRDAGVPVSDFAKWSYSAVVCDPLYDRAGDAGFLATWYSRMFPLKAADVLHRVG